MHAQRIRAHLLEHLRDGLSGHLARLDHAYITQHQGGGGMLADLEGPRGIGSLLHGALASEPEAIALGFCNGGQVVVDLRRPLVAAGHARDDDGSPQRFAQQLHG